MLKVTHFGRCRQSLSHLVPVKRTVRTTVLTLRRTFVRESAAVVEEMESEEHCPFRWPMPDVASRCTYSLDAPHAASPHRHVKPKPVPKILPNILYKAGDTPMVRLDKIARAENLKCDLLGKCEFLTAGGSVKDRVAMRCIEDAEAAGKIKPGDTLIEPTSGNYGIGIAMAAAVKGYKCVIVISEKMSQEKVDVLRALGARVVRTPAVGRVDSLDSHIARAYKLQSEIPGSVVLDQYRNASNALSHYDYTAEEILENCDGKVDMIVCGTGTGGTLTGLSRKLKERNPNCIVVAVDPNGSKMAEPPAVNNTKETFFEVEGIGHDFIPTVCDRSLVDRWYKVADKDSFRMARRLIKEEGLLVGGSCGTAVFAAVQAAKDFGMKEGDRVVLILPDSVRNYITKFLSDDWMIERNYLDEDEIEGSKEWWFRLPTSRLSARLATTLPDDATVAQTLHIMETDGHQFMPVVDENRTILGVATLSLLTEAVTKGRVGLQDAITKCLFKKFRKVEANTHLGILSRFLNRDHFVLLDMQQEEDEFMNGNGGRGDFGILTRMDLLRFINSGKRV